MAPNFAGFDDHFAIARLNAVTMALAIRFLVPGGTLVMKTLSGPTEGDAYVIRPW